MVSKLIQLEKAPSTIVVILLGIITLSIVVLHANVLFPILVIGKLLYSKRITTLEVETL